MCLGPLSVADDNIGDLVAGQLLWFVPVLG